MTTAADAHTTGYGVCRDFTHLAVSFCRALNIPARYVFGYLPEIEVEPRRDLPMDFAAWMEVYLGDRWWTFDPRNNERRKGTGAHRARSRRQRCRDGHHLRRASLESMIVISEEAAEASPTSWPVSLRRPCTALASTASSWALPIGTAPKKKPQSFPSRTTMKIV